MKFLFVTSVSKLPQLSRVLWYNGPQLPVSLPIHQAQLHRVVLQECRPLSDGNQGDAQLGCMPAHPIRLNTILVSASTCSSSCCRREIGCCCDTQACEAMALIQMTGSITCTGAPRCPRWWRWCTRPVRQILDCGRTAAPCPSVAVRLQASLTHLTLPSHLLP